MSMFKPQDSQPEDYSYIWHPAIEDDDQNHDSNVKERLIIALRDTLKVISERDPKEKIKALGSLTKRNWKIFHRLILHTINLYPDSVKDLISHEIVNKDNFTDPSLTHEYFLLIQKNFENLSQEDQNALLEWIAEEPDVENYKNYVKQIRGSEVWIG